MILWIRTIIRPMMFVIPFATLRDDNCNGDDGDGNDDESTILM